MSSDIPGNPEKSGTETAMNTDAVKHATSSSMTSDVAVEQEAIVARFADLMSTGRMSACTTAAPPMAQQELMACFAASLNEGDIVCTVPCLDLKVSSEDDNPMPAVGQHMETDTSREGGLFPIMEASVISAADASDDAAEVGQKAARRLGGVAAWTKSSIAQAPQSLMQNVAGSFSSLVDARVKSWTLLMFRKSLSRGDSSSRSRLIQMLSASIKTRATKLLFKTLQLPSSAVGHAKNADVILPLIFEVVLTVSLKDKTESVTLRAPGTVSGNFDSGFPKLLAKVDIQLDSGALLKSMVDQARLTVFKTVANLSAADLQGSASEGDQQTSTTLSAPLSSLSGGFSSSLRLSAASATQSPQLAKARSSALRLNSVLQGTSAGKGDNSGGIRKQRSVQWDHPMELPIKGATPPSSKKPRVAQTNTRLKSFKSFGRPHADDTTSGPRNATFGNFGRKPIWGRDGKLANHPTPVNALERSREDLVGVKITGSVNATFGSPTPAPRLAVAAAGAAKNVGVTRLPSSLPRTATALESWLMNAAGSS